MTKHKQEQGGKFYRLFFNNIKIDEINAFIDNIEKMGTIRKEFYKNLINNRYEIIKSVYEKL